MILLHLLVAGKVAVLLVWQNFCSSTLTSKMWEDWLLNSCCDIVAGPTLQISANLRPLQPLTSPILRSPVHSHQCHHCVRKAGAIKSMCPFAGGTLRLSRFSPAPGNIQLGCCCGSWLARATCWTAPLEVGCTPADAAFPVDPRPVITSGVIALRAASVTDGSCGSGLTGLAGRMGACRDCRPN